MSEPKYTVIAAQSFAEIEPEFMERVTKAIWCSVTTIDRYNRPRTRVLHPIWEGATGWINTWRHSGKSKHLAHNPYVALAYLSDFIKPLYVHAMAEWVDDPTEKKRIWELCKATPEPYGFDPANPFISHDNSEYGLLRLTPWQIEMDTLGVGTKVLLKP